MFQTTNQICSFAGCSEASEYSAARPNMISAQKISTSQRHNRCIWCPFLRVVSPNQSCKHQTKGLGYHQIASNYVKLSPRILIVQLGLALCSGSQSLELGGYAGLQSPISVIQNLPAERGARLVEVMFILLTST